MRPTGTRTTSADLRLAQLCAMAEPRRCYSQAEIAAFVGVTYQRIGNIERAALRRVRRTLKHFAREEGLAI